MKKINAGIIGCGNISDLYFYNLTQRYQQINIISCADMLPERAQASAEKYGLKACSVEDMLGDSGIEMVINLTIPSAHVAINMAALRAGKHVYTEKPFALNLQDAKATIDLAEEKGLLVGCAPDTFLGAGLQTSRQVLDGGWIGLPVAGVINYVAPGHELWHPQPEFYYQAGGGPMMDMGPYYVTAFVSLLGPIKKISCFAKRTRNKRYISSTPQFGKEMNVDVLTHYSGVMEFENGTIVSINMSFDVWLANLPGLELYGTEGTMTLPDPDFYDGPVKVMRGESIVDAVAGKPTQEAFDIAMSGVFHDFMKEMPIVYNAPGEKIRGMGAADLASAIMNNRKPRISHEMIYHVTEALLAFETASTQNTVYQMTSTCERPEPLPLGLQKWAIEPLP